jgi:hypothetical protein
VGANFELFQEFLQKFIARIKIFGLSNIGTLTLRKGTFGSLHATGSTLPHEASMDTLPVPDFSLLADK